MGKAAAFLVSSAFLVFVVAPGSAVDPGCDFQQDLSLGQTYYVYSPNYPYRYSGENDCRWIATSQHRVQLECTVVDLPSSLGCTGDHLSVMQSPYETNRYCGNKTFTVTSDSETMVINFRSPLTSSGGSFLCRLWAVKKVEYNDNCACGWKNPTRITGGVEAGVNEFPMMAGILSIELYSLYCGGTIISYKHVLTAAHCVVDRPVQSLVIVVGEHDTSTGRDTNATRLVPVEKMTIHPDYIPKTATADIAILTTGRNIQFNLRVGPVCLPFEHRYDSFAGSFVELTGWGLLGTSEKKPSQLQKVKVSVANRAECERDYSFAADSHICTTGYQKDSCQEDSGGPVLWENPTSRSLVLVGIISRGHFCGDNTTSLNTKVGYYMDWIVKETADISYCTVQ